MPTIDIADVRRKLGDGEKPLSQEELGRRLGGVDQATVSRWETGVSKPPKSAVILIQQLCAEKLAQKRTSDPITKLQPGATV